MSHRSSNQKPFRVQSSRFFPIVRTLLIACACAVFCDSVGLPARADFHPPVIVRNVRLIQSGQDDARVSIVMERGRFTAVAADAIPPAGAAEFDGSGLIAYP